MWEHTAIFITWDEWGGFYDPVVPPELDEVGLGVRVPLLTISPYTERGRHRHRARRVLVAAAVRRRQLGPAAPHARGSRRTHGFEHIFDFRQRPREPVFGRTAAPAFGEDPFGWVGDTYPWAPGTDPVDKPL